MPGGGSPVCGEARTAVELADAAYAKSQFDEEGEKLIVTEKEKY